MKEGRILITRPSFIFPENRFAPEKRVLGIIPKKQKGHSMQKPIMIYTLSTCVHCKATKKLLNECAVNYECIDVDLLSGKERTAILDDVRKFNPECSFPTIIIGDKVIVGFQENEIRLALGL